MNTLPPKGTSEKVSNTVSVPNTVKEIKRVSALSVSQPSVQYWKDDTWCNLIDFVLSNFSYLPDPAGFQKIQTPDRLAQTKAGNCVDFTTFLSAVARAKGLKHIYRVTNAYPPGRHIYPVINGRPIDLVAMMTDGAKAKAKGYEPPYTSKKDYMTGTHVMNGPADTRQIYRKAKAMLNGSDPGPPDGRNWTGLAGAPVLDLLYTRVDNNSCQQIYQEFGGAVRAAMKEARKYMNPKGTPGYSKAHRDYLYSMFQRRCDQIKQVGCKFGDIMGKDSRSNACKSYVVRNWSDVPEEGHAGTGGGSGGSGGSGGGGGFDLNDMFGLFGSGGTGGGNTQPTTTQAGMGGLNMNQLLPLLAVGAAVLISRQ